MDHSRLITDLYKGLKKRPEVRAIIPMGYVPGYPVLAVKNDQLVAVVPFLRYKATGKVDQTIVFPIRYVMEYSIPEMQPVKFNDLSFSEEFADIDFDKGVGFFRHDAVKHLDRSAYAALRARVLAGFDMIAESLIDDKECADGAEAAFVKDLQMAVEPSLLVFYKALDNDFYRKYLK